MSDIVVLGRTADGLVAAHLLAGAGHRVTLIGDEPVAERMSGWVPSELARDLSLSELAIGRPEPWLRAPLADGGVLELSSEMARSVASLRRISARDAESWPRFSERMARLARLLERIYLEPPPSLVDLRFALRVRGLGREAMEDLMRLLPMPVAELLDDWFESDALKGALGALAVRHLRQGPRSAGTAFRLLHYHIGAPLGVFRAPRSNLPRTLRARPGVALREAKVARIAARAGEVTGVVLDDGEQVPAQTVVSALDPRRTLDELVEPGALDPELRHALRHVRSRGVAARFALELDEPPAWETLTLAPSLDYVERAYDDVKYGRASARPWLDLVANGKTVDVHMQYAPHGKADGTAIAQLVASHLRGIRRGAPVAPPADWPDAQPHHAELALDQALWMRPLPELARYRTPIRGLWLGGPAMHPGIPGVCGYNCAKEIGRA
ncbi:MAG TPA: NAD(P)/FAD-dependent oxidoreductase [Burkholderiales bacterium]|nr:NAD(P)/FAD-dependent oxidoreductase [Burkholderiales bacterium]